MIAGIAGWIASQFTKVEYGQSNMGSEWWTFTIRWSNLRLHIACSWKLSMIAFFAICALKQWTASLGWQSLLPT